MGLFDRFKSNDKPSGNPAVDPADAASLYAEDNANFAQLYKERIEAGDIDGALEILGKWDKVVDRFDDSNYLLAMISYSVTAGKPRQIIENYFSLMGKSEPRDASLHDWFKLTAKTFLLTGGYADLAENI